MCSRRLCCRVLDAGVSVGEHRTQQKKMLPLTMACQVAAFINRCRRCLEPAGAEPEASDAADVLNDTLMAEAAAAQAKQPLVFGCPLPTVIFIFPQALSCQGWSLLTG